MQLTHELKVSFIERFLPMLYLDREEPDYPVSPVDYVEHAALWSSVPPQHTKNGWGLPAGSDRRPLIEHHGISLNPAHDVRGTSDPDGDGVKEFYLGQYDDGTYPFLNARGEELWLDLAGWREGPDVTAVTANRRPNLKQRPPLAQPFYSAEVWSIEEWRAQIGENAMAARFGIGPNQQPEQLSDVVVVSYHFLFPLHLQPRPTTALGAADDPYSGDYEGDWSSFAVITQYDGPAEGDLSLGDFHPIFGAFGQRWRGTTEDHEAYTQSRMFLRPWYALITVDDHPAVMVAKGTHNLYPPDPPTKADGSINLQWVEFGKQLSEPANKMAQDYFESPVSALMSAKVLAGVALGGIFGAVVGIIAAVAESSLAEEEGFAEPPDPLDPEKLPEGGDIEEPVEDPPEAETQHVAVPLDITAPPLTDPARAEIRPWINLPAQVPLGLDLLALSGGDPARPLFAGRWGVRCMEDPFSRRTGLSFPNYRHQIFDALLTQT